MLTVVYVLIATLSEGLDSSNLQDRQNGGVIGETRSIRTVAGLREFEDVDRHFFLMFAITDLKVERKELLSKIRRLRQSTRRTKYKFLYDELARVLAKMIQEDRRVNEHTSIQRMIYELRDQTKFENYQAVPLSPAARLIEIKYAAVPELIEALDDRRITRSVMLSPPISGDFHILRVGDCAYAIIQEIAGRRFDSSYYLHSNRVDKLRRQKIKEKISRWWSDCQMQLKRSEATKKPLKNK